MFCMKCGQKLADDAKFCVFCGTPVTQVAQSQPEPVPPVQEQPFAQEQAAVQETAPAQAPVQPQEQPPQGYYQPPMGGAVPPQPPQGSFVPPVNGGAKPPKKPVNKKVWMIAGIAAAVVLVVAVAALLLPRLFRGTSGNAYAYLSDGDYTLVRDVAKDEGFELAAAKSESTRDSQLAFSEDGKYIYYYTKVNEERRTGTLCRAELAKLGNKPERNEEFIANNCQLNFYMLPNEEVLYLNEEGTLYVYAGEDGSTRIAKEIYDYYVEEDSNRILYTVEREENTEEYGTIRLYDLYAVTTSNPYDPKKIYAGFSEIQVDTENLDEILLTERDYEKYEQAIYLVDFMGEATCLSENGTLMMDSDYEKKFFASRSEKDIDLMDYVLDSNAAEDAAVTEPVLDNYGTPIYAYEMIRASAPVETDYPELYTSTTRSLYWYGMSGGWNYSMQEALGVTWQGDSAAIVSATQNFINMYAGMEDENGLIAVTPDIKAALVAIDITSGGDGSGWLWLCLTKVQSDIEYDYATYEADYTRYSEAQYRNEVRKALQEYDRGELPVADLYCLEEGEPRLLLEGVVDVDSEYRMDGFYYLMLEDVTEKVPIEEVTGYYDVEKLFQVRPWNFTHVFSYEKAAGYAVSDDLWVDEESGDEEYPILYFTEGDTVYLEEDDGALAATKITDAGIGDFAFVSDEAVVLGIEKDGLYCAQDVYMEEGSYYGDLVVYRGEEKQTLARDVMLTAFRFYADGTILAVTDGNNDRGVEMTLFDAKGEKMTIADDVVDIDRVDARTFLYLSADDLYRFDGEERTRLAEDVDVYWLQHEMESEWDLFAMNLYDNDYLNSRFG